MIQGFKGFVPIKEDQDLKGLKMGCIKEGQAKGKLLNQVKTKQPLYLKGTELRKPFPLSVQNKKPSTKFMIEG